MNSGPNLSIKCIGSLQQISKDQWNALVRDHYPFASYEFLSALERSGSVGGESGWLPKHLIIEEDGQLIAALPLYEKHHSYGEYVFDWQWANAFERYGRPYYPKLLTAIPFTPATGPRILIKRGFQISDLLPVFSAALDDLTTKFGYSSWHLLFADQQTSELLETKGLMKREDVQFHWQNRSPVSHEKYRDFSHFLEGFRASKRKQIKRERRKISDQQIQIQRRSGAEISASDWADFYACYQATYLKRSGHSGYLNKTFFDLIATSLAEQCMLVTAHREEQLIASSLFFFDDKRLYGRYWGALSSHDCLHFEACYYQGIEFAIERRLECFDPGTQGEHKLVRGFEPTKTRSFHRISDPDFAKAIDQFLQQERQHTDRYREAAESYLPFHKGPVQ